MCIHGVAFGNLTAATRLGIRAGREINPVRFEQVFGHRFDARRSVNFEGNAPSKHPRREDQICISHRVVRVKMRHEGDAQIRRFERFDPPIHNGGLCAPHHSGTKIDEVGRVVLFLVSDAAGFVTGALVDVNGGRFLR